MALAGPALASEVPETATVISASGYTMTRAEFERLLAGDPRFEHVLSDPGAKRAVGVEFGEAFALEAEARRRGLDESESVRLKIRSFTQQLLAHELLLALREEYLRNEAALALHYEANRQLYQQPRVRQIVVRMAGSPLVPGPGSGERTAEEALARARELRARIVDGADFAALAREASDDPGSRDRGGDVGFVTRGTTAAELEAAAYSLSIGQVSEPIRTQYGYHLLRVEERRPMPLEKVRPILANDLAHRRMDSIVRDGFALDEAYFGP